MIHSSSHFFSTKAHQSCYRSSVAIHFEIVLNSLYYCKDTWIEIDEDIDRSVLWCSQRWLHQAHCRLFLETFNGERKQISLLNKSEYDPQSNLIICEVRSCLFLIYLAVWKSFTILLINLVKQIKPIVQLPSLLTHSALLTFIFSKANPFFFKPRNLGKI